MPIIRVFGKLMVCNNIQFIINTLLVFSIPVENEEIQFQKETIFKQLSCKIWCDY